MDRVLLDGFRRGEREALQNIYCRYVGVVEDRVRAVLGRIGRLAAPDLADLVQDTFLQAFSDRARAQYDGERDYGPFLVTIARNVVIDWLRRSGREVPTPDVLDCFAEEPVIDSDPTLFDSALLANTEAYIRDLTPELRAIHHVRFVLGLPQRQAAAAIGISRQSLRTLEKKLLNDFRRHLKKGEAKGELPVAVRLVHDDRSAGSIAIAQRP